MIQKYIENPLLVDKRKFDVRAFMLVASTQPYLVLYNSGYARLSLNEFTLSNFEEAGEKITHLTNNAVQKKHPEYKARKEQSIMSIQALREHCIAEGVVSTEAEFRSRFEDKVKEIMRLLFLQVKPQLERKQGTFELFGFDFLVDEGLNPFLIEINVNPALFTDTTV